MTHAIPAASLGRVASARGPLNAAPPQAGSGMTLAAAIACIALVAVDLRPGIVSVGPMLEQIRGEFAISNTQASLLTVIPNVLMGLLALPTPWLARRFGRDRVILAALAVLGLRPCCEPSWEQRRCCSSPRPASARGSRFRVP
jgi:CP family cyanate transporter-like MFS transporter